MSFKIFKKQDKKLVLVLRLQGVIAVQSRMQSGLNAQSLRPLIEKAQKMKAQHLAILINSPGGSPAQSQIMADEIRALAARKSWPLTAFVEDVAASGGYWLACCADHICALPSSLVGSIGVISGGFGFPKLMEKLGIERRIFTAGENKVRLDPFSPVKQEDLTWVQNLQQGIHQEFIAYVQRRRAHKILPGADIFQGDVWLGKDAQNLGLVDEISHLRAYFDQLYGPQSYALKFLESKKTFLEKIGLATLFSQIRTDLMQEAYWQEKGL